MGKRRKAAKSACTQRKAAENRLIVMANVSYWRTFWVDSGETGLLPGHEHYWAMWGFGFLDVLAVTPGPLNSDEGDQILMVKDVRSEADSSGGRRLYFTVRNTGPVRAIGYGLNFSFVSP